MREFTDYLSTILRSLPPDEEIRLIFLKEMWPQIVGRDLGRLTRPEGLNNRILEVTVREKVWAHELADFRHPMATAINRFWGCALVKEIDISCHG